MGCDLDLNSKYNLTFRDLSTTSVSTLDGCISWIENIGNKYWISLTSVSGNGVCCSNLDTSSQWKGPLVRCSDESSHLPNTSKYLICPYYSPSFKWGTDGETIRLTSEKSGKITTNLLPDNYACPYKFQMLEGDYFEISALSLVNSHATVYFSKGNSSYEYVYRLQPGEIKEFTKQEEFYIVIHQLGQGTAALEIFADFREREFPFWILIIMLACCIWWNLAIIVVLSIIKRVRRKYGKCLRI